MDDILQLISTPAKLSSAAGRPARGDLVECEIVNPFVRGASPGSDGVSVVCYDATISLLNNDGLADMEVRVVAKGDGGGDEDDAALAAVDYLLSRDANTWLRLLTTPRTCHGDRHFANVCDSLWGWQHFFPARTNPRTLSLQWLLGTSPILDGKAAVTIRCTAHPVLDRVELQLVATKTQPKPWPGHYPSVVQVAPFPRLMTQMQSDVDLDRYRIPVGFAGNMIGLGFWTDSGVRPLGMTLHVDGVPIAVSGDAIVESRPAGGPDDGPMYQVFLDKMVDGDVEAGLVVREPSTAAAAVAARVGIRLDFVESIRVSVAMPPGAPSTVWYILCGLMLDASITCGRLQLNAQHM